ncbi:MAG TPA: hypothetical protein VMV57_02710 [Terracidiphilus sp.]|nr:hypothetical protein [Terracidiphilus sp.]
MNALNASQAILPALERTRDFLFDRFHWLTFLKLTLVAVLTEGVAVRLRYSFGSASSAAAAAPPAATASSFSASAFLSHWLWLIGLIILLGLPLAVYLLYLLTRLRFAFFHCLTHKTHQIRPAWALYGEQSMRLFELMLAVWAVLAVVAGVTLYPIVMRYLSITSFSGPAGPMDYTAIFAFVVSAYFTIFMLYCVIWLVDTLIHDFLLPHMALENLGPVRAWEHVQALLMEEPRAFATYLAERFALPIVGFMAISIAAAIISAIVSGIMSPFVASMEASVRSGSATGALVAALVLLPLAVLAVAFAICVSLCLGGPLSIWIRNFALLFYGGRYQLLGDLLTPAPAAAPRVPPPSDMLDPFHPRKN